MSLMQAPADVHAAGTPYLRWLALPLALDALLVVLAATLRAHMHARDTLWVSLAVHGLHLVLCPWAMARWGLSGFAMAMAASRVLGVAVCAWLWWRRLGWRLSRWTPWRLQGALLKPMLNIGVPGAGESLAYRLAVLVTLTVVARLGTQALATQSYAQQLTNLLVLYALALGFSLEILIGRQVGAGQFRQADALLRRGLKLALGGAFAIALSAALAGPWLMRLFTQDEAVVRAGSLLLWVNVVLELGRTLNVVVINALRATGDARFPVAVGVVSMVGVMAGGAWFLGGFLGWGLLGVWCAMAADECLRGSLMWWRWCSRAWVPHARAACRRANSP
jgi:Na+-driven multidrug efflux pump